MKRLKVFLHLISLVAILLTTLAASLSFGYWYAYPRGHDALFHIFKAQYILDHWPHHQWWSIWAGGMPLFLYYPPFPHYFLALLKQAIPLSFNLLLALTGLAAVGLTGLALYLLVFRLTKNKLASLLASLFYLTCPSAWAMTINSGVYMRAFAMPFLAFGLYFSILFWQEFETGKFNQKLFALVTLAWGLAILTHQYIALVGLAFFAFLIFFIIKGEFLTKTKIFLKIILLSLFLSATFLVPLVAFFPNNPSTSWVKPIGRQILPLADLIALPGLSPAISELSPDFPSPTRDYTDLARLSPFLLPLGIALAVVVFLSGSGKLRKQRFLLSLLKFSGWMTLLWLVYSTASFLRLSNLIPLVNHAYGLLGTRGATYFLPLFISLGVGILLYCSFPRKKSTRLLVAFGMVASMGLFLKQQHQGLIYLLRLKGEATKVQTRDYPLASPGFLEEIKTHQEENFRLASGLTSRERLYFSHFLPDFLQTGHYFSPGIINFQNFYYQETSLWEEEENQKETQFLLDWWGIRTILAPEMSPKFSQEEYSLLAQERYFHLYSYPHSSPLLAPSQAPVALVVGKKQSFEDSFLRALAFGNLNSQVIIPVSTQAKVESLSSQELSGFDLVFLYDYQPGSFSRAGEALANYVKQGGCLIIESNRKIEVGTTLPDPYPVAKINPSQRQGDWQFKLGAEDSFLSQADLEKFSPAKYYGDAWGVSEGLGVKDWARTILSSGGKPVLVEGQLGKGKVFWSGLNLPYHLVYSQNQTEAEIFKDMLLSFSETVQEIPEFQVKFQNPEQKGLKLKGTAKGVLLKENYFPNWQAKAKTAKGETVKLKILRAGPGFIYVFLPEGTQEVIFLYQRSWLEKIADLISLATLGYLVFLLLSPRFSLRLLKLPK